MTTVIGVLKKIPSIRSLIRLLGRVRIVRSAERWVSRFLGDGPEPHELPPPRVDHFEGATIPASIGGRLWVTAYAGQADPRDPPDERPSPTHRHTWIANWNYGGMEDNDLRGFVDGRFKFAWNQPSQIHVRAGRLQQSSRSEEWELFRVLQRWEGLRLPPGAVVENARIELEVERGSDHQLELFLYPVHKDWNPGSGGVDDSNNSVPKPGEVWWNEVGHKVRPWGLPGAGFASDTHPDADTPAQPVARAVYRPGDRSVAFESMELAKYVEKRVAVEGPLLFLLKLSDTLEDTPGSVLHFFSANHGDDQSPARRPRCVIDWRAPRELAGLVEDVLLEHGRSLILPRLKAKGMGSVAVSFEPAEGCEAPTIHVRGGKDGVVSEWKPADHPLEVDWDWFEVRLAAYGNPVPFGTPFEAEVRDTWVRTGPPEEQEVPWTFISPTGIEHRVLAAYVGDSRWRVRFMPLELGRWRYRWTQRFIEQPYESAEGFFDVVGEGRAAIGEALRALGNEVEQSPYPPSNHRVVVFGARFLRLQRALMRLQTPETFPMSQNGVDGGSDGPALDAVRRKLGGRDEDLPRLEPHE